MAQTGLFFIQMEEKMEYDEFIRSKVKSQESTGFDCYNMNNSMFPFQKWIVDRALKVGKYAIFADCGLGKTLMQLEWARQVVAHTGSRVIILAPLAVTGQTIEEAAKFDISLDGITILNYEQIENIDTSQFAGIVLDESSILKNFEGAIKKKIIEEFKDCKYKLACTATPSPNDPTELGNHSEFLDVMPRTEMLAMYFVHDAGDTGEWRLKGHAVKHFYQWVSTWAVMLNKPSDIGFDMPGYELPPLELKEYKIETPNLGVSLFNDMSISATDFNAELRRTAKERIEITSKIVNNSTESFIVWVKQNEEGDAITKMIPGAIQVKGSDDNDYKKKMLIGFAHGDFRVLVTKPKIAMFGLNYQNCHNQVFMSLDFSFEGLYQAMRRSYRFGQKHSVKIHLITTDTMANVIDAINKKQENFMEMQREMADAINANLENRMAKSIDFDTDDVSNEWYKIRRGDCVRLIRDVPDESVGFSVFSPPFADLFVYSSHVEDMGNCSDDEQFATQFGFLAKELFRVLKPGRNIAIHCMDLPAQKGRHGHIGIRDFTGLILRLFESVGFIYASRITIWKDPVTAMQRTKALGLLHKQIKKDSTMSRVGIPDTVLVFRKDGERVDPVMHYGSYNEMINACNANDMDEAIESMRILDVETWQKYASPIWMDIDQGDTLNGRIARENEDEKHLCPLQLPVIKRLVHLYTNPGDTVLTPFLGIGSELYQSIKMDRKGIGFELKESYYDQAKKNLDLAMKQKKQLELF
jgi:hypothetical protein